MAQGGTLTAADHAHAAFRFYASLNEFLKPGWRQQAFNYPTYGGTQSVKHLIESIGVPHTEVELILANGQPEPFTYLVQADDRIAVYPVFYSLDINQTLPLRPPLSHPPRFLLDNHLGRLARYLRLLGFDTLYFNNTYDDVQLAQLAHDQGCVLLSRDRGLLKRSQVIHGCCLLSKNPEQQLKNVLHRYQLHDQIQPWRRCLRCNGNLQPVAKEQILNRLEPKTKRYYHEFQICVDCQQIYWKGSHFKQLESFVAEISDVERQNDPG